MEINNSNLDRILYLENIYDAYSEALKMLHPEETVFWNWTFGDEKVFMQKQNDKIFIKF